MVIRNLAKAWAVWMRMTKILSREGTRPRVSRFFFKDIVQSVFLFGVEIWMITPRMVWVLVVFQYQVMRRLTGRLLQRRAYRKRDYTLLEAERSEAGFETMETYIRKRQNMVAQ